MRIQDIKIWDFPRSMKQQINRFISNIKKNEQKLKQIKQLVEENKDTAQYKGICESILTILNK